MGTFRYCPLGSLDQAATEAVTPSPQIASGCRDKLVVRIEASTG